ncbi:MAG: tetratricopeptide repeat protein [Pseudomonadota bacterium]
MRMLAIPAVVATLVLVAGCAPAADYSFGLFDTRATRTEKEAIKGQPRSQVAIGKIYAAGAGRGRDVVRAAEWYRQAADQQDAEAEFLLGAAYESGQGVPRELAHAIYWYERAAKNGYPAAHVPLAQLYANSGNKEPDRILALVHYDLAASRLTGLERQRATLDRSLLARQMTAEQIAEAQHLAYLWFQAWVSRAGTQ